jgi:predicted glycoside hydrolase/deacetylase ChbG (UPF0249 family)
MHHRMSGMLIITADDWGRTSAETDAALACWRDGLVTAVSAMVFMADSARAAVLARREPLEVGLHLNLTEAFSVEVVSPLREAHERIRRYLRSSRYATVVYHPLLRADFRLVCEAQLEEFMRLYGRRPAHIDGHHHQHLCANVLLGRLLPSGERVRPSFHFWAGERNGLNRAYRGLVNALIGKRYRHAKFFFGLSQCADPLRLQRVLDAARTSSVEIMTHPVDERERSLLRSQAFRDALSGVELASHAAL